MDGDIDIRPAPEMLRRPIDLRGPGVREELVIGEVGADHDQQVGVLEAFWAAAP